MEASELRIGNWIYNMVGLREEQVWSIRPDRRNRLMVNDTELQMISLVYVTEERLVRMGFVQDEELEYRWHLDDWLTYDFDDKCIRILDSWAFGTREYVHQLQNLYFALTGKELTIKP